jgi:hypothetical protein
MNKKRKWNITRKLRLADIITKLMTSSAEKSFAHLLMFEVANGNDSNMDAVQELQINL